MLSEYFWAFFVTAGGASLLALIKLCYKSKCKKISFCGFVVERDIVAEEMVD